jgi:hypothetical protein
VAALSDRYRAARCDVQQTRAWKATAAGYQRQVAQLVTAADAVAAKADKQYC